MIAPDQIPTDLAIEIAGDVTPDQFMAAARAFFGALDETTRAVAPEGVTPKWRVQVKEGSNVIAVVPASSMPPAVVQSTYARIGEGVRQLGEGNLEASRLPEAALRHLKALSELTEARGTAIPIRLWVRRQPIAVNTDIGRVIREDWRANYKDYGTIEGRLTAIQEHGTLQLLLKDEWLKQTVRCYVPEEKLPEAFSAFRKRIEISGIIHYRRNGTPISVEVESIVLLPNDDDLPSYDDVRGLLKAAE